MKNQPSFDTMADSLAGVARALSLNPPPPPELSMVRMKYGQRQIEIHQARLPCSLKSIFNFKASVMALAVWGMLRLRITWVFRNCRGKALCLCLSVPGCPFPCLYLPYMKEPCSCKFLFLPQLINLQNQNSIPPPLSSSSTITLSSCVWWALPIYTTFRCELNN